VRRPQGRGHALRRPGLDAQLAEQAPGTRRLVLEDSHASGNEETGLSRCEQENARKALSARGLLHEARRGMPARMHFRIDLDRLGAIARAVGAGSTSAAGIGTIPLLRRLLGRPVALYRRLAWAAGSLSGGLLLSHLLLAYRKDLTLNGPSEGWLRYYPQLIGRHCQLSRYEIDGARSRLTERGFLEARYTKTLPTNRVLRLRFDRLIAAIEACHDGVAGVEPRDHDSLPHSAIQASDKPAIQTGAFRHPGKWTNRPTGIGRTANRQSPNPPTSRPVLPNSPSGANPHSHRVRGLSSRASEKPQEINPYPPPAPAPAQPAESDANGGWRRSRNDSEPGPPRPLVFSGKLLPAEQAIARQWLADIDPDLRQLVLDEHSGMVRAREVWNPLGYLQTLIQSARAGRFTPTIAFRVAQSRQEALARAEAQRRSGRLRAMTMIRRRVWRRASIWPGCEPSLASGRRREGDEPVVSAREVFALRTLLQGKPATGATNGCSQCEHPRRAGSWRNRSQPV
jgi:hypothetical protein